MLSTVLNVIALNNKTNTYTVSMEKRIVNWELDVELLESRSPEGSVMCVGGVREERMRSSGSIHFN